MMWMVSDALERECEYSHFRASSVTSPNQKSHKIPKWKNEANQRMTKGQEEENKHNITKFKIAIKFIVNTLISYNTRKEEALKSIIDVTKEGRKAIIDEFFRAKKRWGCVANWPESPFTGSNSNEDRRAIQFTMSAL